MSSDSFHDAREILFDKVNTHGLLGNTYIKDSVVDHDEVQAALKSDKFTPEEKKTLNSWHDHMAVLKGLSVDEFPCETGVSKKDLDRRDQLASERLIDRDSALYGNDMCAALWTGLERGVVAGAAIGFVGTLSTGPGALAGAFGGALTGGLIGAAAGVLGGEASFLMTYEIGRRQKLNDMISDYRMFSGYRF